MSRKSQRTLLLWVLAFILLVAFDLARDQRELHKANAVLAGLFSYVVQKHPGTAELRTLLSDQEYSKLQLDDRSPKLWAVETPIRFGAKNWIMYADIDGSEIRAVRIRTADSNKDHPKEAPPDNVLASH